MLQKRYWGWILGCNSAGIALYLSWYLPVQHGIWFVVDSHLFFFFYHQWVEYPFFLYFVAIINNRAFDSVSLLCMGGLYYHFFCKKDYAGKRRMMLLGIIMLLTAVVLNQCGHLLASQRPSPTNYFSTVYRVTQLINIDTKDDSSSSFPGDHGMMLLIFAGYMWRFFSFRAFLLAMLIVIVFSLPRIMIGAHWFSDIAVGSLSVVLVGLSWWLLTDACVRCLNYLDHWLCLHFPRIA